MEENKDVQIHAKKIPAFTVFKNGSILKNIFLLRNPPPSSTRKSAVNSSLRTRESNEEILLVGRHPNCNIRLEHPSISRFHLRIQANPSSHTLSVIDLSSVHGTWVSGKRIDPGVHVKLKEGDTVKMGSSSRIYELHWVPLSQAYDTENPFVPAMYMSKEREEQTNQDDENRPCLDKLKPQLSDDDLESSKLSCSNKIQHSSLNKLNPLTSSSPNDLNSSCDDATVEHFSSLGTSNKNGEIFVPLIVPGTEDSNSLNESENKSNWSTGSTSDESEQLNLNSTSDESEQLNLNGSIMSKAGEEQLNQDDENDLCLDKLETQLSDDDLENSNLSCSNKKFNPLISPVSNDLNSSFDDAAVEHFSPSGTCNKNGENGEISGTISATEDPDSLNESENQSNWSRDNMNDEFKQLNHGILKDDPVSMALSDSTNLEKDALNQEIARGTEIDMGDECELLNQQKIENDSVPVVLFDGVIRDKNGAFTPDRARVKKVDIDGEFEQMNQSKMKIESASIVLFDDNVDQNLNMGVKFESFDKDPTKKEPVFMDQEQTLIPDISRTNEVHMNLFDGLDENEWDIFTPDKENKNPNSCSVKSMKKKDFSPKIAGFSKTLFTKVDKINDVFTPDKVDSFVNREEVLCSLENKSKSRSMKMEGSCKSINYSRTIKKNFPGGANKRWTMVVDTNSLLHGESLKHLKILQGLKGTQLLVPKIVMKELLDIKGQHNHSKKSTKSVSLALKWIEECTANTRSWIHVDEEIEESEVLETALHLLKTTTDRQVIILSTDLTLKIKAMAEGVMCEEAKEFRMSLVNPFSERFMWVGSMARGRTSSCVDDAILRQKYYGECLLNATCGLKGLTAATFR